MYSLPCINSETVILPSLFVSKATNALKKMFVKTQKTEKSDLNQFFIFISMVDKEGYIYS